MKDCDRSPIRINDLVKLSKDAPRARLPLKLSIGATGQVIGSIRDDEHGYLALVQFSNADKLYRVLPRFLKLCRKDNVPCELSFEDLISEIKSKAR